MSIAPSLTRKLREALGQDAGSDLVTWLEEEQDKREQLRADLEEFRQEMHRELASLRELISKNHAELMKWSFVFWVGAVFAIAAIAGVLKI